MFYLVATFLFMTEAGPVSFGFNKPFPDQASCEYALQHTTFKEIENMVFMGADGKCVDAKHVLKPGDKPA